MSVYDIIMLGVLGFATLFGAWKGMAWQIASLSSLVLSYVAAFKYSEQLAQHLSQPAPLNRFIAMGILYAGTSMAIWLIFRVIAGIIDSIRLKGFDRQLGALFGVIKGLLLCIGITLIVVVFVPPLRPSVLESKSGNIFARLINKADKIMPPEIHEILDPYLERVSQNLSPTADSAQANSRSATTSPVATIPINEILKSSFEKIDIPAELPPELISQAQEALNRSGSKLPFGDRIFPTTQSGQNQPASSTFAPNSNATRLGTPVTNEQPTPTFITPEGGRAGIATPLGPATFGRSQARY